MRVVQVVRPAEGGIRRHVEMLCRRLPDFGVIPEIVAPDGLSLPRLPDTPVHAAPITSKPHPLLDLRAATVVAQCGRNADLLHGHGLRGGWIAHLASRRCGRPYVVTIHNLAASNVGVAAGFFLRRMLAGAAAIITVSKAAAESLKPYGIDPAQVTVIPNGIELADFDHPAPRDEFLAGLGLPLDRRIVAAAGRLSPEKGFHSLIQAASTIACTVPNVLFVIAGGGPEHSGLEVLIKSYAIENCVRLVGKLEDISSLFHVAELVVVPSLSEGQGIVALEAMACGRPVVASNAGGLPETVQDQKTGVLFEAGNRESLENAISSMLSDTKAVRMLMGELGRELVSSRFSASAMIQATVSVYQAAVNGRPKR